MVIVKRKELTLSEKLYLPDELKVYDAIKKSEEPESEADTGSSE